MRVPQAAGDRDMRPRSALLALAAMLSFAAASLAQTQPTPTQPPASPGGQMPMMQHQMGGKMPMDPIAREFREADEKMHHAMRRKLTGDVDRDFVTGMIPHHQGAIDMAKILLAHSQDAELRQLAEGIIGAQEKEIAQMRDWLARHPAK
jgi:uncharacterized protein (DUF305 family)